MLTNVEENILVNQLKAVFRRFVDTEKVHLVDAVVRLSVDSVKLVIALEQSLLEPPEDASTGPLAAVSQVNVAAEVRCPNCRHVF